MQDDIPDHTNLMTNHQSMPDVVIINHARIFHENMSDMMEIQLVWPQVEIQRYQRL